MPIPLWTSGKWLTVSAKAEDDLAAKTGAVLRSPVAFPLSLDTPRSLIRVEAVHCDAAACRAPPHPLQELQHRHVAERPAGLAAREHVTARLALDERR